MTKLQNVHIFNKTLKKSNLKLTCATRIQEIILEGGFVPYKMNIEYIVFFKFT